jgi:hypothetical protein
MLEHVTDSAERAFIAEFPLERWSSAELRHENGSEYAAEIIAWALMDQLVTPRVSDTSCDQPLLRMNFSRAQRPPGAALTAPRRGFTSRGSVSGDASLVSSVRTRPRDQRCASQAPADTSRAPAGRSR